MRRTGRRQKEIRWDDIQDKTSKTIRRIRRDKTGSRRWLDLVAAARTADPLWAVDSTAGPHVAYADLHPTLPSPTRRPLAKSSPGNRKPITGAPRRHQIISPNHYQIITKSSPSHHQIITMSSQCHHHIITLSSPDNYHTIIRSSPEFTENRSPNFPKMWTMKL